MRKALTAFAAKYPPASFASYKTESMHGLFDLWDLTIEATMDAIEQLSSREMSEEAAKAFKSIFDLHPEYRVAIMLQLMSDMARYSQAYSDNPPPLGSLQQAGAV